MFWLGLGVGAMIGGALGFFIMALCVAAREDDNNGNN